MRVRLLGTYLIAVSLTVFAAACSSDRTPVAPARAPMVMPTPDHSILFSTPKNIIPLQRNSAVASQVVTQRIGFLGGVVSVPSAGLTLVFPPLSINGTVSVTVLPGTNVAYEFLPHQNFTVPVVMLQSLANTQVQQGLVNPLSVFLGYFPDSSNPTLVTELLNVNVNLLGLVATSTLTHFSGYIIAVGCEDQ